MYNTNYERRFEFDMTSVTVPQLLQLYTGKSDLSIILLEWDASFLGTMVPFRVGEV